MRLDVARHERQGEVDVRDDLAAVGVHGLSDLGNAVRADHRGLLVRGLNRHAGLGVHIGDDLAVADVQLEVARGRGEVRAGVRVAEEDRVVSLRRIAHNGHAAVDQRAAQLLVGGGGVAGVVEVLDVNRLARELVLGQRQGGVAVLEEHDGLLVRKVDALVRTGGSHDGLGVLQIAVRVLKQAQREHFLQQADVRLVDALVREDVQRVILVGLLLTAAPCFLDGPDVVGVGDDVGAGVDGIGRAGGHVVVLHAPGHVADDAGVGVDVALMTHLIAEQIADERLVEREANRLAQVKLGALIGLRRALGRIRLGVVRHDGGNLLIHSRLERREVVSLQRALGRVGVPLAQRVMRIEAVLTRAAAREVLDGQGDAVLSHAVLAALEAHNDTGDRIGDELGALAERAVGALPARVGGHVGHVHIALLDAAGVPLGAGDLSEIGDQLRVTASLDVAHRGSREAEGARPRGEHAGGVVHAEGGLRVLVAGVGVDHDRDAVRGLLSHLVQRVDPLRQLARRRVLAQDEVAQPQRLDGIDSAQLGGRAEDRGVLQILNLLEQAVHGGLGLVRDVDAHAAGIDDHHADLLVDRHAGNQILRALLVAQLPVLIGIELAVAVRILVVLAIDLDNALDGIADGRAVLVLHPGRLDVVTLNLRFLAHGGDAGDQHHRAKGDGDGLLEHLAHSISSFF